MAHKYKVGDRVKVTFGQLLWSNIKGEEGVFDLHPEWTEDTATVTRASNRYSPDEPKFHYTLHFDKYGSISWFDEENIIPA